MRTVEMLKAFAPEVRDHASDTGADYMLEAAKELRELYDVLHSLSDRIDGHFGGPDKSTDWKQQEDAREILRRLA